MDLGFLSELLGGQGKGSNPMLTMLLPLLLGGKGAFSGGNTPDPSAILSQLLKGKARDGGGYPPLFGEDGIPQKNMSGMMDLLGSAINPSSVKTEKQNVKTDYPYELQYNRPYQP